MVSGLIIVFRMTPFSYARSGFAYSFTRSLSDRLEDLGGRCSAAEQARNRKPRPRHLSSSAAALARRPVCQRALSCQTVASVPIAEIVRRSVNSCANCSMCTQALCSRDLALHGLEDGGGRP